MLLFSSIVAQTMVSLLKLLPHLSNEDGINLTNIFIKILSSIVFWIRLLNKKEKKYIARIKIKHLKNTNYLRHKQA